MNLCKSGGVTKDLEVIKRLSINYAESHLDKVTRFENAVLLHIKLNAERVLIKLPS